MQHMMELQHEHNLLMTASLDLTNEVVCRLTIGHGMGAPTLRAGTMSDFRKPNLERSSGSKTSLQASPGSAF